MVYACEMLQRRLPPPERQVSLGGAVGRYRARFRASAVRRRLARKTGKTINDRQGLGRRLHGTFTVAAVSAALTFLLFCWREGFLFAIDWALEIVSL
jgi:hypothetical protein